MSQKQSFDRAAHCRAIAGKGGKTTASRHGRAHTGAIGRRGRETTTRRYFAGNGRLPVSWLVTVRIFNYSPQTNLTMKYDVNGLPIWSEACHIHPARLAAPGRLGLFETLVIGYAPLPFWGAF